MKITPFLVFTKNVMNMKKLLFTVGLLSAGVAFGQTTTKTKSTTTSTSSYNNSNTGNYNSQNATSGTNSSTNRPSSTTTPSGSSMGTMSTGTSSGSGSNTGTSGMGTTNSDMSNGTSGTGSDNSTGSGSTTNMTPSTSGIDNINSTGTGTSATTPSGNGSLNTNTMDNSRVSTSSSTYSTQSVTTRPERTKDYKNFAYGIYVGVNTTKFQGESFDANKNAAGLTGRVGYQAGFFVRGGGRLYGQIGAEYFASSSNYFTASSTSGTTTIASINDQINIRYVQVPVYIGYKLTESDRGISSVRVQVGVEYANQIGSTAGKFGDLNNFQLKNGTFNGLGQLGFDAGPVFLDLTYHYGFSDSIQRNTGFAGSQRRILSASLGFKF